MLILTPGQIQLPVKIQTARGLYRAADKALCIMLFFPLFRCKARPLPAPYSE